MVDNVIFERSVGTGRREGDVTIKLTADGPNEVARCTPHEVSIIESFGTMSPMVSVTLMDKNGDLFNHMKIGTDIVYTLSVLRSINISVDMRLRVVKYRIINGSIGRPSDLTVQIQFAVENWLDIAGKERCRGWYDIFLSDAIQQVAEECGYDEFDISKTSEKQQTIVQPYWDNAVFTKWAKSEAIPKNGNSHFEYGATTNNKFFFKNIDELLNDNKSKIRAKTLPTFKLQSFLDSAKASKEEQNNNKEIPAYFYGFDVIEEYMGGVINGTGGIKTLYYDFDKDEYVKKDNDVNSIKFTQLSDLCSLEEKDNKNYIRSFHGRGTKEKEDNNKTYLSDLNLSVMNFSIVTDGNPLIHIFDVVEVVIPNTVYNSKELISQLYSGFYVIASVKHSISFMSNAKYSTTIGLIRHGVDDNGYDGLDGLQKSGGGKI